jgi:hypothetical protein
LVLGQSIRQRPPATESRTTVCAAFQRMMV